MMRKLSVLILVLFSATIVFGVSSNYPSSNPYNAVHVWHLDDNVNGTATNSLNSSMNLALNGSYAYNNTLDKVGTYYIDAKNNNFNGSSPSDGSITGQNITVSWWMRPKESIETIILDKWGDAGGSYSFSFMMSAATSMRIYMYVSADGTTNYNGELAYTLQNNALAHIAVILAPVQNNCSLYVNGTLQATLACTGGLVYPATQSIVIGGQIGQPRHFDGDLDEVIIFNRKLTQDEITTVYTGNYPTETIPPTVILSTPTNNTWVTSRNVNFTGTATDADSALSNCSVYTNSGGTWDLGATNSSCVSGQQCNINYTFSTDGAYIWNYYCCDASGNCGYNNTGNYTLYVDSIYPSITLNYPSAGESFSSSNINFTWTPTDNMDTSLVCNLTINGVVNASNIASANGTATNYSVSGFNQGAYNWNVTCFDNASNVNTSETRSFTMACTPLTECTTLSSANTKYCLNNYVNSTGTCFTISAYNVTLDCQGYTINYSQAGTASTYGIYTAQLNTTIRNCNIVDGNSTISDKQYRHGIYYNSANNGLLFNNTVNVYGNSSYGILLNVASNNNLTSNTGTSNSSTGIYLLSSSNNNTLTSNTGTSTSSFGITIQSSSNNNLTGNNGTSYAASGSFAGIYLLTSTNNSLTNNYGYTLGGAYGGIALRTNANNNILTNNIGTSNSSYGIYLLTSSNNNLTSNTGTSNSSVGIYLWTSSNNNTLTSNNGTSNSSYGIYLATSSNNILTSNTGTSTSSQGILLYLSSNNNILTNNTGTSNSSFGILVQSSSNNNLTSNTGTSNSSYGIYVLTSNNSILTSNTGTSNSNYGIFLRQSNNNILTNTRAEGYLTNSYGIVFRSANNTIIQDCINISGIKGDVLYVTNPSVNNTFINCSYNMSKETVIASSDLTRKWYYRAYVNDSDGNNVPNVNVTAYNVSGDYAFNISTDATGYTEKTEIIDYVNEGGTRRNYSNYIIYANNVSNIVSHSYSASQGNNLKDAFYFDAIHPSFIGPSNNASNSKNGEDVLWSANFSDDLALHTYIFSWNGSASWVNDTPVTISGSWYHANTTKTIAQTRGKTICGKYYVNDTTGNGNVTDESCFVVSDSPPTITIVSPNEGLHSSTNLTTIANCNDTDGDSVRADLYVGGIINASNISVTLGVNYTLTSNIVSEGTYSWLIGCNDGTLQTNSTSRTFTLDFTPPLISCNITSPSYFTTNYTVQCQFNDTYLNGTQMELINTSDAVLQSSVSSWKGIGTVANMSLLLNLSILPDGNYTMVASADDYASDSPLIPELKYVQISNTIEYAKDKGENFSCTMSLIDKLSNPLPITSKEIVLTPLHDTRHIITSMSMKVPDSDTDVIIWKCSSNNPKYPLEIQSGLAGLFHTGKYFMHYKRYEEEGYKVASTQLKGDIYIAISPSSGKWSDLAINGKIYSNSSLVGGLNFKQQNYTIVLDTSLPVVYLNVSFQTIEAGIGYTNVSANATDINGISKFDLNISYVNGTYELSMLSIAGASFSQTMGSYLDLGRHNVTTYAVDTVGNNVNNQTYFIVQDTISPTISLDYPANNSNMNSQLIQFNFTCNDSLPSKAVLYGNFSGSWAINQTISYLSATRTNFSMLNIADGGYIWNILCNDTTGNKVWHSSNYSLNIDSISPIVQLIYPGNASTSATRYNTFKYNVTDVNAITNCSFYFDDILNWTNTSITRDIPQNFSLNTEYGQDTYNWTVQCYDTFQNYNVKSYFIFTYSVPSSGSVSSGETGGGGAGDIYQEIKQTEISVMKKTNNTLVHLYNTLTSNEKIPNNGICEGGEWPLIDKDCKLNALLSSIWLLRIVMLITIILFFMQSEYAPMGAIASVALLIYNGGLGVSTKVVQAKPTIAVQCWGLDFFRNMGDCLWRSNPLIGWGIVAALVFFLVYKILK